MILIKLDLWPGGDPKAARQIGEMRLSNLSELADISNLHLTIEPLRDAQGDIAEEPDEGALRRDRIWMLIEGALLHALRHHRGMGFPGR